MQIAIIDNYDSFTYNLVHVVEKIIQEKVTVFLNDKFELTQLETFDKIILSPGPGLPQHAGKTMNVIEQYKAKKNILGVCLGHQAISVAFGATLKNLDTVFHGIATNVYLTKNSTHLFDEIEMPMQVGRYHSWVINKDTLSKDLLITSVDDDDNIMSIKHRDFNIEGVQFHPESIMTTFGETIIRNWVKQ